MAVNKKCTKLAIIFLFLAIAIPNVLGATASISQSGADIGVMKGIPFSLTVSGLSGSGQATLQLPSGFSTSEETTKSFSGTSVSWTTITANEKLSSQTISVLISIAGSPSTATTSAFNVVLAPSLSLTPTPSSKTVTTGEVFDISLNVQNTGETTAQSVLATLSLPSGLTTTDSSTQSIGTINGGTGGTGGSSAVSWTITASSPSSSSTISISVTSSNADTKTTSISITGPSGGTGTASTSGGGGGGGAMGISPITTEEFREGKIVFEGSARDTIGFILENISHTVKIEAIRADAVDILITSITIRDTIKLGETKSYDVNNNSINDISIKVNSISGNKTSLTITSLLFIPTSTPTTPAENITEPTQEQIPVPQPSTTPSEGEKKEMGTKEKNLLSAIAMTALFVLVIIVLVMFFRKREPPVKKAGSK